MTMPKGYVKEVELSPKTLLIIRALIISGSIGWLVIAALFHDNPIIKEIMNIMTYLAYG